MRWSFVLAMLTLPVLCPTQLAGAVPITVFSGVDSNLASISAPRPNSEAAIAGFQAHVTALGQSISTTGFETLPVAEVLNGVAVDIGAGVEMAVGNTSSLVSGGNTFVTGIRSNQAFPQFGFNTTAGGSHFLRIVTQRTTTGQTTNATVTFDFATPIDAFGLSLTGLGSGDGSLVTLQFVDGSLQTLPVPGGNLSSTNVEAGFFGFVDADASISSVIFDLQFTNSENFATAYMLGIDDITLSTPVPRGAVPEPASVLLLITGIAGIWLQRRHF